MTVWHGLYLLWLLAGSGDFVLHRRSAIEVTSGLRESSLHLLQIGLLGTGTLLWLLSAVTPALWLVLLSVVCLHALAGYWDTRVAFPVRTIVPLEQHVHSILDIAPWVALGAIGWPLLSATPVPSDEGGQPKPGFGHHRDVDVRADPCSAFDRAAGAARIPALLAA
jgi:hypothetical protein